MSSLAGLDLATEDPFLHGAAYKWIKKLFIINPVMKNGLNAYANIICSYHPGHPRSLPRAISHFVVKIRILVRLRRYAVWLALSLQTYILYICPFSRASSIEISMIEL